MKNTLNSYFGATLLFFILNLNTLFSQSEPIVNEPEKFQSPGNQNSEVAPPKPVTQYELEKRNAKRSSNNQAERRTAARLQISLLPLGSKMGLFSIGYNLNSNLSAGFQYVSNHDSREISETIIREIPSNTPLVYEKIRRPTTALNHYALFFRFFPWETVPLFLELNINRVDNKSFEVYHLDYYTDLQQLKNEITDTFSGYEYTVDHPPAYYPTLALGFVWQFNTGFFMGFDIAATVGRYEGKKQFYINPLRLKNLDYAIIYRSLLELENRYQIKVQGAFSLHLGWSIALDHRPHQGAPQRSEGLPQLLD